MVPVYVLVRRSRTGSSRYTWSNVPLGREQRFDLTEVDQGDPDGLKHLPFADKPPELRKFMAEKVIRAARVRGSLNGWRVKASTTADVLTIGFFPR